MPAQLTETSKSNRLTRVFRHKPDNPIVPGLKSIHRVALVRRERFYDMKAKDTILHKKSALRSARKTNKAAHFQEEYCFQRKYHSERVKQMYVIKI